MKYDKWLTKNTENLKGKTVAISGSTGGLGKHLCRIESIAVAQIVVVRTISAGVGNAVALEQDFQFAFHNWFSFLNHAFRILSRPLSAPLL